MYDMFQKMMARMMSEQAEAKLKEAVPKSKLRKKPVKKQVRIIRKKVQPDTTSEESESVEEESEEEEQIVYKQNPPRQSVKIAAEEPESVNKPKSGAPAEDLMSKQMKEMNRAIKDIQAKGKGKQTYTLAKIFMMV